MERSSYEAALAAENAGTLCTGEHDGQSYTWTYDINTGRVCKSAGMMGGAAELNDGDALYGDYLPCVRSVWTSGNGDPDYYTTAEGGGIVFANSDGDLLNGITYASAGCFYDQPLAPVKIGDKWAYLDRKGNQVTQAVYDAVYGGLDFYEDYTPKYASPLLNGYAAICRDGKWGVLDAAGKEYIPCDYAGAAWNGHILWLQKDVRLSASVSFVVTCALIAFLFPRQVGVNGVDIALRLQCVRDELLTGAMLFSAVFLLNEPYTCAHHRLGRILYGVLVGAITMGFRYYGVYETGVCFALLTVNSISGWMDRTESRLYQLMHRPAAGKEGAE